MSAMFIVSSTSSICSSLYCWCCVCGLPFALYSLADGPENDRFVRFADVAIGNSLVDGTCGFVHAFVVCCGPVTIFAGSDFLFCIVFLF